MSIDYEAVDAEFAKSKSVDLQELRRLAEEARKAGEHYMQTGHGYNEYETARDKLPSVDSIIDRLARAEKVCRIASKYKYYNEVDDALAEWRGE